MKGLVKRKRKIPKASVEGLLRACEDYGKSCNLSAEYFFKKFLWLMDRYSDYFFSEAWPEKFDIHVSTVFSDEDLEFLFEGIEDLGLAYEARDQEFIDRLETVCLRKNFFGGGFMGYFGMHWTRNAFHKRFVRPLFEPVLDVFDGLTEETDARKVLDKLLEEGYGLKLVHDSLIDLLENSYPRKPVLRLIGEIFFLLHEEENYPNCWHHRCAWYCKQRDSPKSS
jgi:hypothetical protein